MCKPYILELQRDLRKFNSNSLTLQQQKCITRKDRQTNGEHVRFIKHQLFRYIHFVEHLQDIRKLLQSSFCNIFTLDGKVEKVSEQSSEIKEELSNLTNQITNYTTASSMVSNYNK